MAEKGGPSTFPTAVGNEKGNGPSAKALGKRPETSPTASQPSIKHPNDPPKDPPKDPVLSQLPPNSQVVLQVGERQFTTSPDSLQESAYFRVSFSKLWKSPTDGSYFIDADPDLFKHLLRYMRHYTLPLFYDMTKGHDHGMYLALLREARYFQIKGLVKYLEEKMYYDRIKTVESVEMLYRVTEVETTVKTDEFVHFRATSAIKRFHICPRGRNEHRDQPERCRRQKCSNTGEIANFVGEEIVDNLVRISRRIIINDTEEMVQECASA